MYIFFVCVYSCIHLELDDEDICSPYLNHMIFNYANESYYKIIVNKTNQLESLLDLVSGKCRATGVLLTCSILFIPCNLTTGAPIPLCSNDCSSFESECPNVVSVLIDLAEVNKFPFIHNCENTLSHLSAYYNNQNSSSYFKDNCLALPGMLSCDCNYVRISKF